MPGCCAFQCSNRRESGLKLFRLPQGKNDQERRKTWIAKIKRDNFTPTKHTALCQVHFEESQFEPLIPGKLKPNAVPSIFSHIKATKPHKCSKNLSSLESENLVPKVHFEKDQFEKRVQEKKLKPNAIPSIFPKAHVETVHQKKNTNDEEKFDHTYHSCSTTSQQIAEKENVSSNTAGPVTEDRTEGLTSAQVDLDLISIIVPPQGHLTAEDFELLSSNYCLPVPPRVTVDHAYFHSKNTSEDILSNDCPELIEYSSSHFTTMCPPLGPSTSQEFQLLCSNVCGPPPTPPVDPTMPPTIEQFNELKRKVCSLRKRLYKTQSENRSLEKNFEKIFHTDQIQILKGKKQVEWSDETMKKASEVRFVCGSRGYSMLRRQGFPYPSERTLRRRKPAVNSGDALQSDEQPPCLNKTMESFS